MPPKKVDKGQVKAEEKRKQRVAEDKTFGLKNKNRSKAVQKYIKGVQAQAKPSTRSEQQVADAALQQKEDKKRKLQQDALLASLFKGAENMKTMTSTATTTNPTMIKEDQKIDLYVDQRDEKTMRTTGWDATTDIICKHFLDAVESNQYGWFWVCAGGGNDCKYRHCLPPGFVLKRDISKEAEDVVEEPVEDIIERDRAALPAGGTPVTKESLLAWKAKKEQDRLAAIAAKQAADAKKSGGKASNAGLSGRDLFAFDPTLFIDDDGAASDNDYVEGEDLLSEEDDEEDDDKQAEPEGGEEAQNETEKSIEGGAMRNHIENTNDRDNSKAAMSDAKAVDGTSSDIIDLNGIGNKSLFLDGTDDDELEL